MTTKESEIAGWFCYNSYNGKIFRCKYHIDGDKVHKDTKEYYESQRIVRYPLTQDQYDNWSLDRLEAQYPRPKEES